MEFSTVVPPNGHTAPIATEEHTLLNRGFENPPSPPELPPCPKHGPRYLAIASIVCGISCLGIAALINAVKAEGVGDPEAAKPLRRKSRRLSILSLVLFPVCVALLVLFVFLLSYAITRIE